MRINNISDVISAKAELCIIFSIALMISVVLTSCVPTGIIPGIGSNSGAESSSGDNLTGNSDGASGREGSLGDLSNKTRIIGERYIDSVDDTKLTLNIPDKGLSVSEGDIIASGSVPGAPDGFLMKVVSIEERADGKIDITMEPVSLEQAVKTGNIDIGKDLSPADIDASGVSKGKANSDFSVNFDNVVIFDADNNESTIDDRVVASGVITVSPSFKLAIEYVNHKLVYLKFLTNMKLNVNLSVSAGRNMSSGQFENSVILDVNRFKPIEVNVDSIPVVIRPVMSLLIGGKGQNVAGISTQNVFKGTYQVGTIYQDGEYRNISDFSPDFSASAPKVVKGGNLRGYASVVLSVLVYGSEGLNTKIYEYHQFVSNSLTDTQWNLFGGLQSNVRVTNDPISDKVKDNSKFIDSYKHILLSGDAQVSRPVLSPAGGTFVGSVDVSISCDTPGASIYYTTDGSEPDEHSALYTGGTIRLVRTTELKVRAYKAGMLASSISSGRYVIEPPAPERVAPPVLSPAGGTFVDSVDVSISCDTPGASIYYTTDGSEPDEHSALYTGGAIRLVRTTELKVRAYKAGMLASTISSGRYVIEEIPPWANSAGGQGDEAGYDIGHFSDRSIIVVGAFERNAVFGRGESNEVTITSQGVSNIFIAKYDSGGGFEWVKQVTGTGIGIATSVSVFSDDSFVVAGYFTGDITFGAGESNETSFSASYGSDIFLAKYNSDGTLAWAVRAAGTGGRNQANDVVALPDGSCVFVGTFINLVTFGEGGSSISLNSPNSYDIFVARYNSSGVPIWVQKAGSDSLDDAAYGVAYNNGNIFVTGYIQGSAVFDPNGSSSITLTSYGDKDIFIAKFNYIDGSVLWAKQAGGEGNDIGYSIDVNSNGVIAVTGSFLSSEANFGSDGGGYSVALSRRGNEDIFVARYDGSGSFNWATSAGGTLSAVGKCINILSDGSFVVAGKFSGDVMFGKSPNQITLSSAGGEDIFVARFAGNNEDVMWAKSAGGASDDACVSVTTFASSGENLITMTGYFSATAVFGRGETVHAELTAADGKDIFVTQYKDDGSVNDILSGGVVTTSPMLSSQ